MHDPVRRTIAQNTPLPPQVMLIRSRPIINIHTRDPAENSQLSNIDPAKKGCEDDKNSTLTW